MSSNQNPALDQNPALEQNPGPKQHRFVRAPHRTLLGLSAPLLLSLIAEPLTGLADTAFVARLGAAQLAGLGAGAAVLSSLFWVFNFLGIGTQSEVARGEGSGDHERAGLANAQALLLSVLLGLAAALAGLAFLDPLVRLMGATGELEAPAKDYIAIRLWGAPAVLMSVAAFGTLRGLQDMRTPLWIAGGVNLLNILADPLLIFGYGPIPRMEVTGAALASVVSQWVGAVAVVTVTVRRLGWPARLRLGELGQLAAIGRDLFLRTASLNLFLLVTTRVATEGGADVGAAHQGIRQVWVFTALFLDAFAIAGQSLVAYFLGAGQQAECRRVAAVVCQWSLGAGALLMAAMFLGRDLAAVALIPPASHAVFFSAWSVAALSQPVNALSFATDGIHWGTGDFRYLRNAVIVATMIGLAGLTRVDASASTVLLQIWIVTLGWTTIRAAFGMLRIWPGWGRAPLAVTGPDGNEAKN